MRPILDSHVRVGSLDDQSRVLPHASYRTVDLENTWRFHQLGPQQSTPRNDNPRNRDSQGAPDSWKPPHVYTLRSYGQ